MIYKYHKYKRVKYKFINVSNETAIKMDHKNVHALNVRVSLCAVLAVLCYRDDFITKIMMTQLSII